MIPKGEDNPAITAGSDGEISKTTRYSVTIIGDIMFDIVSDLGGQEFRTIERQLFLYRPVDIKIAGTGVSFAAACTDRFKSVHLLCRLSSDALGNAILADLRTRKVNVHHSFDPCLPTGIVLRLNEIAAGDAIRLMIGSTLSASQNLSVEDIDSCKEAIREADLFVADGYCVLHEPRRAATLHAMQIAHDSNVPVVFDIVPHNAYEFYSFSNLSDVLSLADVVITELGTIRRFLGTPTATVENYDLKLAEDTANQLMAGFEAKAFLLRFGNKNMCDNSLICMPNHPFKHAYNGYSESNNKDAFGDRLAVAELLEYLDIRNRDVDWDRGNEGARRA